MLAGSAGGGRAGAGETGRAAWWDQAWSYRLCLSVPPAERRADINTARLDLGEQSSLCAPDGRDVRVVTQDGRVVPYLVNRGGVSHLVEFYVPPDVERLYVYYGNEAAASAETAWERRLGGLTLETRPVRQNVTTAAQLPAVLRRPEKAYGREAWGQINDLQNPFGPDDHYVAIYEGTIYCPEDGLYAFGVNADDLASFRLYADGSALVHCWRNAGVPSPEWRDPRNRAAVQRVKLDRGVYRIQYVHVENAGAQLAKLGWQTPSSSQMVTVPPRAFSSYLPVEIEGREVLGAELNPFFVSTHDYNLVVNGQAVFPHHTFVSRSGEDITAGQGYTYRWDFGDGNTAEGREVEHEFADAESHSVTLTVSQPDGGEASVTRIVRHPGGNERSLKLAMELDFPGEMPIVGPGEEVGVNVLLRSEGGPSRSFDLQTIVRPAEGESQEAKRLESRVEDLGPRSGEDGWLAVAQRIPGDAGNLHVSFRLLLHGRLVLERELAVLRTDRPLGQLSQDSAHNLRDEEGRLVVLRIADLRLEQVPPRVLSDARNRECRVLVLDESLGGRQEQWPRQSYVAMLAAELSRRYAPLRFTLERPQRGPGEGFPPVGRFLASSRAAIAVQPQLVVLACEPEAVLSGVPLRAFEAYLVATVDQVLSQTTSHVIIIAPPPLPGRPELARRYARIAKRVGLRKGVPVADLYSRFLLTPHWQGLFRWGGAGGAAFTLSPNRSGQELISSEVLAALLASVGGKLAVAAREAAYAGPG